jgi:hypothetical protein
VRIVLQVTGGFTGPAGKQTIDVDTTRLPAQAAAKLEGDLQRLPPATWKTHFLKAHPAPWDFVHELRIVDGGSERSTTFHTGEGPPELAALTEQLTALSPGATGP